MYTYSMIVRMILTCCGFVDLYVTGTEKGRPSSLKLFFIIYWTSLLENLGYYIFYARKESKAYKKMTRRIQVKKQLYN